MFTLLANVPGSVVIDTESVATATKAPSVTFAPSASATLAEYESSISSPLVS